MRAHELLTFAADRLVYVHGENEGIDFVRAMRREAAALDTVTLTRDQLTNALREAAAQGMDSTSGPSSGQAASCRKLAADIVEAINDDLLTSSSYESLVECEERAAS